jgi:hypothetical protein
MGSRRPARCLGLFGLTVVLGSFAAAGCSSKPNERPVFKVSGRLTYAGKPMSKAEISFYPVDPNDRSVPSHGIADDNGRYQLRTYRRDDGAPAGDCVVTITWPGPRPKRFAPSDPDGDALAPDRLRNAYSRAAATKLRATVREEDNVIDFNLP